VRSTENALLNEGNKSDKIDARKLGDLLRGGYLRSVYYAVGDPNFLEADFGTTAESHIYG
jgi:hypothetical protein